MINQKHKSMRPNPGVKKIQNYLFKFCDFLGKGNFSSVYKGINEVTKQTVAIKYIALNSLTCERLKQLLDQQIEILTSLNHPNILKCYQVLKSAHNCYIVTELCDGGDLQGYLKKKRILSENEMIPFVRDIFQGLYYLSKKNIVHRDIKLANVFLNKGKAKIADFGFAQRAKKQFNDGKIGTPLCMSPEGFLQNLYGCKTDVWAFGVILYQLTHGRLPLEHCTTEDNLRHSIQVQLRMDQLKSELSLDLKDLILKCLDVNPCTRLTFQDMKSCAFIRRITGERPQSMSLHDLRYLPALQSRQSEESRIPPASLRNLDNHLQDQLNQNVKENQIPNYGTKNIYQGLKPQNRVQRLQIPDRLFLRPGKINPPSATYITVRTQEKQTTNIDGQNAVIMESPFEQNDQYEVKVMHKSFNTLPNEDSEISNKISEKQDQSMRSTADRDFLEVPSTPQRSSFKRHHKGSFEMSEPQQKLVTRVSYHNDDGRTTILRPSFDPNTDLSSKREKTAGIQICPISNTKRLLNGFMKFNQVIGLIHFCRLVYKYIAELKATGIYHEGDLNLRYYSNFLLNLMNELINKITSDHIILTKTSNSIIQQENKDNKLVKMRKVIEEYIQRYRPNLEKERGDYLNRTTGQIKQIAQLDQRFIETFFIPDKSKLQTYNLKIVQFSEILQKCSRYQKYSEFDSNKELEESTKQDKKQRPLFAEKNPQILINGSNNKEMLLKAQTFSNKQQLPPRKTSIHLQEEDVILVNPDNRRVIFQ